jgi:uncharacterized protein
MTAQSIAHQDSVLQDFLRGIASVRSQIRRLVLFGSRARGNHRTDSDYDVLVVVMKKDNQLRDALYDAVMDVLLAHGRLVSLKIYDEREFARLQFLQPPFMKRIADEGILLG